MTISQSDNLSRAVGKQPLPATPPISPEVPATTASFTVWVVPHTHWDREWYLPFECFRIHLALLVDDLLDALREDPSLQFTLDGQAIPLEDYLAIRPDQEERLREQLSSGRLLAGPSYVLPDEFLSGPEALVRNLLLGRAVCRQLGAKPMAVGYAPDTFGHIAQLPQLLNGFGMDSFVFWRGLGDEADSLGATFRWQAPDGSSVLAVRLLEGYANGRDLGRWTRRDGWLGEGSPALPEVAASRVSEFLERWRGTLDRSGLKDVLLANGVDHAPLQRDLPRILSSCAESLPGTGFRIGNLSQYLNAIEGNTVPPRTIAGELVGGMEACVVRGVNSTRLYLKQSNEEAERALFVAEALASLAWLKREPHGYQYPHNELTLAWRKLLKNHPHDSLPGCSLDEVHRDMEPRFRASTQIAREVSRLALNALAGRPLNLRSAVAVPPPSASLVNLLPWPRRGLAELPLPPDLANARELVADTPDGPIPAQIAGSRECRRALMAPRVRGFGATTVELRRGHCGSGPTPARVTGPRVIENEFYRVESAADGTLTVEDLTTGRVWTGLHRFQDDADRGDEYSFCPVDGSTVWDSEGMDARTRVISRGPVVAEMEILLPARLPRGLAAGRRERSPIAASCPIRTRVRLVAGVDRIEFHTTVLNRARDHRLRVLFASPDSPQEVRAEGHFALLRRPAQPVWNGRWREPPAKTHHTLGLVAAGGLVVMSRGLPEYEALPRQGGGLDIALTLLRCVGWLSWPDLSTRPKAEEPHIATPDAQCQGLHSFDYAVSLRGEDGAATLLRAAQDYRVQMIPGPDGIALDGVPALDGEGFVFSALKGAEDGNGVVARVYNPGEMPAVLEVTGKDTYVHRCRLDEEETRPEAVDTVAMRAGEIATLRITHRRADR